MRLPVAAKTAFAMSGMFGAVGILIFSKSGGIAFDAWAP
jgi:hypothetical protein